MEVKHLTGWTFEVSSRSHRDTTYLVQLDCEEPNEICQCVFTYCQTAAKLKRGAVLGAGVYCAHVKAVALHLFDNNILSKAREGLK